MTDKKKNIQELQTERWKTKSTTENVFRLLKPLKSEGSSRLPACTLLSSEAFLSFWHQIHFHFSRRQHFVHSINIVISQHVEAVYISAVNSDALLLVKWDNVPFEKPKKHRAANNSTPGKLAYKLR